MLILEVFKIKKKKMSNRNIRDSLMVIRRSNRTFVFKLDSLYDDEASEIFFSFGWLNRTKVLLKNSKPYRHKNEMYTQINILSILIDIPFNKYKCMRLAICPSFCVDIQFGMFSNKRFMRKIWSFCFAIQFNCSPFHTKSLMLDDFDA